MERSNLALVCTHLQRQEVTGMRVTGHYFCYKRTWIQEAVIIRFLKLFTHIMLDGLSFTKALPEATPRTKSANGVVKLRSFTLFSRFVPVSFSQSVRHKIGTWIRGIDYVNIALLSSPSFVSFPVTKLVQLTVVRPFQRLRITNYYVVLQETRISENVLRQEPHISPSTNLHCNVRCAFSQSIHHCCI